MAANFAFQPYGLSQQVTVGSTPATVSFATTNLGGGTVSVGGNPYQAPSLRLVNEGTAAVYLQFGPSTTVTVGTTTGMKMLSNSVEVFTIRGQPVMAAMCASTFTVTLTATLGEGL